jgi:hypothetical protein
MLETAYDMRLHAKPQSQEKNSMRMLLFVISLILGGASAMAGDLPDPAATPGATAPDVTQANIKRTICVPGFTKPPRRPPAAYTSELKRQQLAAIGGDQDPTHFEEDHLVALSLGGAPRDPKNLWPQHWAEPWGAKTKDALELRLQHLVCAGTVPLAIAQRDIAADWIAAYKRYCPAGACPGYVAAPKH